MLSDNKKNMFFSGNILKKIVIIIVGSVIAAYGITLALYAGFGGATLAVLWQGISKTFHISIGMASLVVAVGMILFALIYDKSQIHIGTVLYQIVYSLCVDLFATCHVYSKYMWINFFIMLAGVILFAVGTGLYASVSLGRGSYEAVTFALAEKKQLAGQRSPHNIRYYNGCNRSSTWRKIWRMYNCYSYHFRTNNTVC